MCLFYLLNNDLRHLTDKTLPIGTVYKKQSPEMK